MWLKPSNSYHMLKSLPISQSNILGFYDPCLGEAKQLIIKYRFQHRLHEVSVDDTAPVACPLRCKYPGIEEFRKIGQ